MKNWDGHAPRRPKPKAFADEAPAVPRLQGDAQEKRLARKVGFQRTPNSGSRPMLHQKGDGTDETRVFEAKTTKKGSYRLTRADLAKLRQYALLQGKDPVFIVTWEDELLPGLARDYAVIPLDEYLELTQE